MALRLRERNSHFNTFECQMNLKGTSGSVWQAMQSMSGKDGVICPLQKVHCCSTQRSPIPMKRQQLKRFHETARGCSKQPDLVEPYPYSECWPPSILHSEFMSASQGWRLRLLLAWCVPPCAQILGIAWLHRSKSSGTCAN